MIKLQWVKAEQFREGAVTAGAELSLFCLNIVMRHKQRDAFSQAKVKESDVQIPTRSLCLSSVLVVFLQPGCHTVDPEVQNREGGGGGGEKEIFLSETFQRSHSPPDTS